MLKVLFTVFTGVILGISLCFLLINFIDNRSSISSDVVKIAVKKAPAKRQVLGFLPFWLINKAKSDYSDYITTLDYFGLTIDTDGTILRSNSPVELEPGYYALTGGKLDQFLQNAKAKNLKLSLTVFDGNQDSVNALISDPITHAGNLINDVAPIMSQYGFSDLNLDIESTGVASSSAQLNFEKFVAEVKNQIGRRNLGTFSMDVIPVDLIRNDHLAVPASLSSYLDRIIIMAYDFHSPSSFVTGPVAPLYGAGSVAEFDTDVALQSALLNYDSGKILLGVPTYGYSWETIDGFARAAIVPASVVIESNKDVEDFLATCSTCSVQFDSTAQEKYVIYKNQDTGTYQQIFYPESDGMASKINFVKGNNLGGVAIWALGYEGSSILNPIQNFLTH